MGRAKNEVAEKTNWKDKPSSRPDVSLGVLKWLASWCGQTFVRSRRVLRSALFHFTSTQPSEIKTLASFKFVQDVSRSLLFFVLTFPRCGLVALSHVFARVSEWTRDSLYPLFPTSVSVAVKKISWLLFTQNQKVMCPTFATRCLVRSRVQIQ